MKRYHKLLSLAMSVCLVISMLPLGAVAVEAGAEAAPQHLAACSAVCAHTEHSADCGYVAPTEEIPCAHTCGDGTCAYAPDAVCPNVGCTGEEEGHAATVPGTACDHAHSADCGYQAATEGTSCGHNHAADAWVCAEGCPTLTVSNEPEPEKELTETQIQVSCYDAISKTFVFNQFRTLTHDAEDSNSIVEAAKNHEDVQAALVTLQVTNARYYISKAANKGPHILITFNVKAIPTMIATVSGGAITYQIPDMAEPAPYTQEVALDGSATFFFTPNAGFELSGATLNDAACTLTLENGVYSYVALEQDLPYGGTLAVTFVQTPVAAEDLILDLSQGDIAASSLSDSEYLVAQNDVRRSMPADGTLTLTGTATSMANIGYNSPSKTAVQIADGLHLNLATTDLDLTMNYQRAHAITLGKNTVVNWNVSGDTSLNASYANSVKLGENARLTITGSGKFTAVNEGVDCAVILEIEVGRTLHFRSIFELRTLIHFL